MQQEQDTAARILTALRHHPQGMSIAEIAREAGINRNTAARQLDLLRANGQAELREFGTAKVYYRARRVPLSAFLCFTRDLILVLDSTGRIVQINDRYCKLARREKDDLIGLALGTADLPIVSTPEAMAVIEGTDNEQVVTDLRYPHTGGDLFFHLQAIPTTFEDGKKGLTVVLEDITDRHRMIEALKKSEDNLHAFMFALSQPAHLIDSEGTVLVSNEVAPRRLGVRLEDYVGRNIAAYLPPEIADIRAKYLEKAVHEKTAVIWEDTRQDLDYEHHLIPIIEKDGSVNRLAHIGFNTTAWKRAESALRESEARFRSILDNSIDALYRRDLRSGCFDFFSPAIEQITGYSVEQILGMNVEAILRRVHPEDLERVLTDKIGTSLTGKEGTVDYRFLCRDGTYRWLSDRFMITYDAEGAPLFREGILRDITDRKRTQEVLQESEERFREVFNLTPIPAVIVGEGDRVSFVNRQFTDLFGYTEDDVAAGGEWFSRAFPDLVCRGEPVAPRDVGSATPDTGRVRCKNGEEKTVRFRPIILSNGDRYITFEEIPGD